MLAAWLAAKTRRLLRRNQAPLIYFCVLLFSGLYVLNVRTFNDWRNVESVSIDGTLSLRSTATNFTTEDESVTTVTPVITPHADSSPCSVAVTTLFSSEEDTVRTVATGGNSCQDFAAEANIPRLTLHNVFNNSNSSTPGDVTLVTQLTLSRLGSFNEVLMRWQGPVSAAIHVEDPVLNVINAVCHNQVLTERGNVYIHLMRKTGKLYPVNQLRNLALSSVTTDYVFLTDADFIPNKDLYKSMLNVVASSDTNRTKRAYVVAAFGVFEEKGKNKPAKFPDFPETRETLLQLWDSKAIEPVHFTKFIHGHYQTNYTRWRKATELYPITWFHHYEPYVVVRTIDVPLYAGAFLERYFDKVSHIFHLHKVGFEFWGIPNVYTVHMPHAIDRKKIDRYWKCALKTYNNFVKTIEQKYAG